MRHAPVFTFARAAGRTGKVLYESDALSRSHDSTCAFLYGFLNDLVVFRSLRALINLIQSRGNRTASCNLDGFLFRRSGNERFEGFFVPLGVMEPRRTTTRKLNLRLLSVTIKGQNTVHCAFLVWHISPREGFDRLSVRRIPNERRHSAASGIATNRMFDNGADHAWFHGN